MSDEKKTSDLFTHSVTLDCDAKFTTIINEKEETIEFIYVDNIHIRQYTITYAFNDPAFSNILPKFLKDVLEELLVSKNYKIYDINDSSLSIVFYYRLTRRDLPITVKLNIKDFTAAAEGSLSEIEFLKAQNSQMRTELTIIKNVLARNANKVRITMTVISDACFVCKDPNDKSIVRVPENFVGSVNEKVYRDSAKILAVRIKKIQHLMKIDVDLELYSKECYYLLTHHLKTEFETKRLENFEATLTESSDPIFLGSSAMKNPFDKSDQKNEELYGVYLSLWDRRLPYDGNNRLELFPVNTYYGPNRRPEPGLVFFPDHFPLIYNGPSYTQNKQYDVAAFMKDKKEIDAMKDTAEQRKLINERAIIEELLKTTQDE